MHGLDVAVIGGGIGGLTTAIALRQAGHRPTVYEQTVELRAAGAGISVWSNGVKALNLLGLGPVVDAASGRMDRMAYASHDGDPLCDFSLEPMVSQVGQRPCPISRTVLQTLLTEALGPDDVHLGARCVGVEAGTAGKAIVTLADGTRLDPDVVVAADGTHSVLRDWVVARPVERRYVGYVNWNGLVDWDPGLAGPNNGPDTWITWVGHGQRVSLMPVGARRCYFFFDVPLDTDDAMLAPGTTRPDPRHELANYFREWAPPVRRLLELLDPAGTNRVPIFDHDPLPVFVRNNVALIGDAAHTMSPDLGQGGCQAMEDALVLTRSLTANSLGVPDALARYQAARQDHTADIVRRARKRSDITHGVDPARTEAWYRELAAEDGTAIIAGLVQSVLGGPLG
jgi:FAD-dependent urate hydroxylase